MNTHIYEVRRCGCLSLRTLRESVNLQQAEVAKKLEVDQTAVSNWERGKCKPLRKYHKKLARIYGVSVECILQELQDTQ